jgi:hypothetical protein
MKLNHFVSGSALLLTSWLGLTFFNEVSPQQYPKQRRGALPAQAARTPIVSPATNVTLETKVAANEPK